MEAPAASKTSPDTTGSARSPVPGLTGTGPLSLIIPTHEKQVERPRAQATDMDHNTLTFPSLRQYNKSTILDTGPRYTPGCDPDAPNLEIREIVDALDYLSLSERHRVHLGRAVDTAVEQLDRLPSHRAGYLEELSTMTQFLLTAIRHLSSLRRPADIQRHNLTVRQKFHDVAVFIQEQINANRREYLARVEVEPRAARDENSADLHYLLETQQVLEALERKVVRFDKLTVDKPVLLITGQAGTGKTHSMCDLTSRSVDGTVPTLLVLARTLNTSRSTLLDNIALSTGLAPDGNTLLKQLNRLGVSQNRRALLIVDGINEGNHSAWSLGLDDLFKRVSKHRHLGLVLTVRTPYQDLLFTGAQLEHLTVIEHPGLSSQEFDAQHEFFSYYGIPPHEVPLLNPEFANPLFLTVFCKATIALKRRHRQHFLRSITSGQKGMTHLFEQYVIEIARDIEGEFGLPHKFCWNLFKGNWHSIGFAGLMADRASDWLPVTDALTLIVQASEVTNPPLTTTDADQLLNRLTREGLVDLHCRWHRDTFIEAIGFPYQRFSDHVIARHLLEKHLDTTSTATIQAALKPGTVVGSLFTIDQQRQQLSMPSIVTALLLEFPERIKRKQLPHKELVHYLPTEIRQFPPLYTSFLDGLYWRSNSAFSSDTDHIIDQLLNTEHRLRRYKTLNTLVGLATRPGHPYSALRLQKSLWQTPMGDRDLFWSEFLRYSNDRENQSSLHRVLSWIERINHTKRRADEIDGEIRLLSLGLTTTVRNLRDRLTQALVTLGCHHPAGLFRETVASLGLDDPYVPERMLAASYGVLMRMWAYPKDAVLHDHASRLGHELVEQLLLPDSPHQTTHTLIRDYAKGIIDLARRVAPGLLDDDPAKQLGPPWSHRSPFSSASGGPADVPPDSQNIILMDFLNYTIGSLMPGRPGSDFNMADPDASSVYRQILWRVQDLGYDPSRFGDIDDEIRRDAYWQSRKIDRYGKKYSWIAYFEMYGLRADQGLLPRHHWLSRTSDCDLDPSFPEEVAYWKPAMFDPFSKETRAKDRWLRHGAEPAYSDLYRLEKVEDIAGPWVLLDGFIRRRGSNDRELTTSIRTIIADRSVLDIIGDNCRKGIDVNGSELELDRVNLYTYAGEIPWSNRFLYGSRDNGKGNKQFPKIGQREFSAGQSSTGLIVENPACEWLWEGHHSLINPRRNVTFVAPAICHSQELVNHAGTYDLFDQAGKIASIFRQWLPEEAGYTPSHLLYIRKDLIQQYLKEKNQHLAWLSWGRREIVVQTRSYQYQRTAPTLVRL